MEIDWPLFWSAFFASGIGATLQTWRYRKYLKQRIHLLRMYGRFYEATGTPVPMDGNISRANIVLIEGFIKAGKDALEGMGVSEMVYREQAKAHERFLKKIGEKK